MTISTLCLLCTHLFPNIYDKASNCKSRFLNIYIMSFIALLPGPDLPMWGPQSTVVVEAPPLPEPEHFLGVIDACRCVLANFQGKLYTVVSVCYRIISKHASRDCNAWLCDYIKN
jgi:hypothetical protein